MNITKEHNRDRSLDKNLQDDWIPDQQRSPDSTSAELTEYGDELKQKYTIGRSSLGKVEDSSDSVSNFMNKDPIFCTPDTRIAEIKYLLKKYNRKEILVINSVESKNPIGMIGPEDLDTYEVEHSPIPSDISAAECMRPISAVVHRDSTLEECLNVMRSNFVDRLPVVDGNGHMKGMIYKEAITSAIM